MKTLVRAFSLCAVVVSLSLTGCEMVGGDTSEGASAAPDLSAQFKAGGCCDKAAKGGGTCTHPCCAEALAAGKVCENCNS